jgi:hypothetical protein
MQPTRTSRPVTAKALDFALAVAGHELGAVARQQAMAT